MTVTSAKAEAVACSTSPVTLRSGVFGDGGLAIYNSTGQTMYVLCGSGTVSASLFTIALANGDYWEAPYRYSGAITCVLASGSGNAMVTGFA